MYVRTHSTEKVIGKFEVNLVITCMITLTMVKISSFTDKCLAANADRTSANGNDFVRLNSMANVFSPTLLLYIEDVYRKNETKVSYFSTIEH